MLRYLENRRDQVAGGRFQPGISGNPGGRPKEVGHVRELAREHTEEAIRTLAAIMQDGKEPVLDRGWGRAEMTANVKLPRDVRDLSREELLAIIGSYADAGEETGEGEHESLH